jgi:hypothetical protein
MAHAWLMLTLCLALALAVRAQFSFGAESAGPADPAGSGTAARAAYLYNFLGYVEWPSRAFTIASEPFVIGVMNADPVGAELLLSTLGREVNNRPVTIRLLKEGDSLQGLHLLYVGPTDASQLEQVLHQVPERWTVTVTENDNGLLLGSAINFRDIGGRLRFEVSMPAANRGDFRLSSRMLSVAIVQQGTN